MSRFAGNLKENAKDDRTRHFICYMCRLLAQVISLLKEIAEEHDCLDCYKECFERKKIDYHKKDNGSWP